MPSEVKADDKYEFYNVSIKPENVTPAATVRTLDGFAFKGIYNKVDITQDINNSKSYAAFLGANNTLFKAKSGSTTKGFRAYFAIPNSTATSALRVVVDGNATSIKNINCGVWRAMMLYTICKASALMPVVSCLACTSRLAGSSL